MHFFIIIFTSVLILASSAEANPLRWIGPILDETKSPRVETWDTAFDLCTKQNARLPSIKDFSRVAMKRGAKGLVEYSFSQSTSVQESTRIQKMFLADGYKHLYADIQWDGLVTLVLYSNQGYTIPRPCWNTLCSDKTLRVWGGFARDDFTCERCIGEHRSFRPSFEILSGEFTFHSETDMNSVVCVYELP